MAYRAYFLSMGYSLMFNGKIMKRLPNCLPMFRMKPSQFILRYMAASNRLEVRLRIFPEVMCKSPLSQGILCYTPVISLSYSLNQIAGAIPNSVILKVFLNRNCRSCWMRIHRLLKSKQIKCHNAKTAASSQNGNLRYIQKLTARIFISTFRVCTKFQ